MQINAIVFKIKRDLIVNITLIFMFCNIKLNLWNKNLFR
jgi:hypothetical protein